MRIWIAIGLVLLGVVAAKAIPPEQQIIMFGGQSAASNPPPTGCASTGVFDLSNVCNDIYFIGALK